MSKPTDRPIIEPEQSGLDLDYTNFIVQTFSAILTDMLKSDAKPLEGSFVIQENLNLYQVTRNPHAIYYESSD